MEKVMKGKAWKFGNNIDTDQIYPGIYVELTEMEDIKKHALSGSAEPKFADEVQPGDIVVAGTNFGCGSSREHAAMTLKGAGVGAVLAESFGRIFFSKCNQSGASSHLCVLASVNALKKVMKSGSILNRRGDGRNPGQGSKNNAFQLMC